MRWNAFDIIHRALKPMKGILATVCVVKGALSYDEFHQGISLVSRYINEIDYSSLYASIFSREVHIFPSR